MTTPREPAPTSTALPSTALAGRERVLVLVAIGVTVLAWASAFVVIRGVAPHVGGGALALGRLLVGTAGLGVLMLVRHRWAGPTRREWMLLVLYGVGWFGAYNVALNLAEHTLDAGTTAMIVNIGPILIALGAGLILGEGIPKWLAIGAGGAFAGVVLIGVGTQLVAADLPAIDPIGIVWCLVAAVTYAIGVLAQKPVVRRLPTIQVTFIGCAIGTIVTLPFAGQLASEAVDAPLPALVGILYLGLIPTALAFTTWGYALARVPAGQLGISTYIVPPLAIIMGWWFFAEVPALLAIIGGAVCLLGVALSRRTSRVPAVAENLPE